MTKTRVYIVFKEVPCYMDDTSNQFVGVFFTRESAETWIKAQSVPHKYFIETYQQPEDGIAEEVFD